MSCRRTTFLSCLCYGWLLLNVVATSGARVANRLDLDAQISHTYYFESHGRDDIREWRAAILKGAQYLKIDFNFITDPELCRQQQQLPSSYNMSMGCFLLVHSFDNRTFWGDAAHTFNTTFDIAEWLSEERNMDVIMLRPIIFQVCLKGKPNLCDGSSQAAQWIALVDAFYAIVQPIIANTSRINSNVQFVFDQLNQADQCILERWRPWNSTWVGEAGTGEDNNRGGNETFQMVNMEVSWYSDWQRLNNTHMGKFHDGAYAMVAWEPVSQAACNGFFAYFRTFRYANPAGVILAYNSDPSMFHVLTASETDRYSHFPFGPEQALTPVIWYSDSRLFTISLLVTDTAVIVLTIHDRMPRGKFSIVASAPMMLAAGDANAIFGGGLNSMGGIVLNHTSVALLVAGVSGSVVPVIVNFGSEGFAVDTTASPIRFSFPLGESPVSVGFSNEVTSTGDVLVVVNTVNSTSRQLIAHLCLLSIPSGDNITVLWTGVLSTNATVTDGLSTAVSLSPVSGWVGIVVVWSTGRSVFTAVAQGALDDGEAFTLLNVEPPIADTSSPAVKVGVGKTPSVTFAPSTSQRNNATKLLVSYGWSFCYNDMFIDDDALMMLAVKICDLQDASYIELAENPVNSYVFSSFADFFSEVSAFGSGNQPQHRNGFATSCSDTVFHGVFDVGFNASVALVPRDIDDVDINFGGYLGISVMTSLTLPTLSMCGEPQLYDGRAILDTFPLFGFYNQSAI
jgi:hypothetical protein